ncbi:hypothetical protein JCGZ_18444 [Jatropha curcas]|uniref:Uncharacterized protein n=1 Tax=Jatropha curcas TaxID=180498 RepID=A0A067KDE0_JATCU|nr:hypothetical protein JCGZ_18444 [Jatropha curcas]
MVLSNKKLKQKEREAKAQSLAEIVSGDSDSNGKKSSTNPEGNSQLQELLEAAKQRIRLSKREKRRKTLSLQGLGSLEKSINEDNVEGNKTSEEKGEEGLVGEVDNGEINEKKKKKRKREEGETKEKGEIVKETKKAKKKKKKQKKKKNKKVKSLEEKVAVEAEGAVEATAGISESQMNEDIATKVYVGGIPYYSTEDDIRSYFESCGTITGVDCKKFPDSGKFRGIAIISFKTEAAAKRALALDGSDMGGFYLKIQPYKTTRANKVPDFAPKIVEGYNRVYVGNLSWDITEDDLRKFFSDCNISSVRWGMDKETNEFRGYAHVDFSDSLSLLMALKLDQQIVCGRPIKISCAVPMKGAKTRSNVTHVATGNEVDNIVSASVAVPTVRVNEAVPIVRVNEADKGNEAGNDGPSVSSGKIRRRTCYECGQKGHISSACPKKQTAETNTDAS